MQKNTMMTSFTRNVFRLLALLCVATLLLTFFAEKNIAQAQAVSENRTLSLIAIIGNKASISINDGNPKVIGINQNHQGIKLLQIQGQEATFLLSSEHPQRRITLRIGHPPYSIKGTNSAQNDSGGNSGATPTSPTNALNAESAQSSTATAPNPQATRSPSPPQQQQAQPRARHGEIVFDRQRDNHFYAQATIQGKNISFLVDTGATFVVFGVPQAEQLGIDYKKGRMFQTMTANGPADAYEITLPAITIQGVTLYNINAQVSPGLGNNALLGQSFLRKFRISIKNNQMILQPL